MNLAIILDYQDKISECISILKNLIRLGNKLICLQAMTYLAIINYLRKQFDESRELLKRSKDIQRTNISAQNNEKSYHTYFLSKILNDKSFINPTSYQRPIKKLFVIGDNHSLTSHSLNINILGNSFQCDTFLIKGCKQWDPAKNTSNQFKNKLNKVF